MRIRFDWTDLKIATCAWVEREVEVIVNSEVSCRCEPRHHCPAGKYRCASHRVAIFCDILDCCPSCNLESVILRNLKSSGRLWCLNAMMLEYAQPHETRSGDLKRGCDMVVQRSDLDKSMRGSMFRYQEMALKGLKCLGLKTNAVS